MCMEYRRFSQTMASEWQTAFVVSRQMPWCLAHCRQELQQKSWKTARLFLQDRDQDQEDLCKKWVLSLEWNSECVMDGESGEHWAGGKWVRECNIISSVLYARLTEWDKKLIIQDQYFVIQDQNFYSCPRGALRPRPRPWSRGRLRNDLYCVEWDVKLYTIPYLVSRTTSLKCAGMGEG